MTKIRSLNKTHRDILLEYGQQKIASLIDRSREKELFELVLAKGNEAIRKKYPEADMVVLRRYNQNRFDSCLRFQFPSGRVDCFSVPYEQRETMLADIPSGQGCMAYPVDADCEAALDEHTLVRKSNDDEQRTKNASFLALVNAAKTLEDVLEVIDLPADVQSRLGKQSTAMVALSPDTLTQLKDDFKLSTAA